MTFDDIPGGQTVFLDANVLLYYFTAHPKYGLACQKLLDRIDSNAVTNIASSDPDFNRVPGITRYAPV